MYPSITPLGHLTLVIFITQIAALVLDPYFIDKAGNTRAGVPYFPIEISRTAASLPFASILFKVGMVSLAIHIDGMNFFLVWVGLLIVAFFDDVDYWHIHMFGVGILITRVVYTSTSSLDHRFQTIVGLSFYFARVVLKALTIIICEFGPTKNYGWDAYLHERSVITEVVKRSVEVMYTGSSNHTVSMVLKTCGVLQWIGFWLLADVFLSDHSQIKAY